MRALQLPTSLRRAFLLIPAAACVASACAGQVEGGTAGNEGSGTYSGGSGPGGVGGVSHGGWPDGGPDGSGAGGSAGKGSGGTAGSSTGGTAGTGTGGNGGSSTGGSAGSSTGGSGGAGQGLTLYRYDLGAGSWSKIPLANVWTGANAPPPTGIVAAVQLELYDRLLVFTAAGKYYLRSDGIWQKPVATTQVFAALSGLSLGSVYELPSAPGDPPDETLTFVANPTAVLYQYHSNDAVVYGKTVTMKDDPPPAAPQKSGTVLFDFEVRKPSAYGQADYVHLYSGYADGHLYRFDAAFNWVSWPFAQSPFWNGKANAPDPTTLTAAWTEAKLGIVDFVGP